MSSLWKWSVSIAFLHLGNMEGRFLLGLLSKKKILFREIFVSISKRKNAL
jgi:hypothetical protein